MACSLAKKLFEEDSFNLHSPLKQCDDVQEHNSFSPMVDDVLSKRSSSFLVEDEDSRDSGIGLDDSFIHDECPLSILGRPFAQLNKVKSSLFFKTFRFYFTTLIYNHFTNPSRPAFYRFRQ